MILPPMYETSYNPFYIRPKKWPAYRRGLLYKQFWPVINVGVPGIPPFKRP